MTERTISIKNKIASLSSEIVSSVCYGYGCSVNANTELNDLLGYKKILDRHTQAGTNSCLSASALACLEENIAAIIGTTCENECTDLVVDESKVEEWRFKHKDCTGHESWERWLHYVCGQVSVEAELITNETTIYEFNAIKSTVEIKEVYQCGHSLQIDKSSVECPVNLVIDKEQICLPLSQTVSTSVDELECQLRLIR